MTRIQFGTDGWRGVIAEDFTFENVRRVAQATACFWTRQGKGQRTAFVGYDQRFLSEVYARLVSEVLAANGIRTFYPPEPVPTPAVSLAVRQQQLSGAVMITASHNPPEFNGYKLKASYGGPADPELCHAIEQRIDQSRIRSCNFESAVADRKIMIADPRPAHRASLRRHINLSRIRKAGLRVVIDSMHGCGGRLLEELIGGETIAAERDVYFGGRNPEPIRKNLGPLCAAVKRQHADLGLATDGDADRLGVVDDKGRYVSIQLVFALLLLHMIRHKRQVDGEVVKSSNCSVLIERICHAHNLKCVTVPVGFKHICARMREHDVMIGGEESGGIGFRGHMPERDGILACLMVLEMLAVTGQTLSQALKDLQHEFGRSSYDRLDLRYPLEQRQTLMRVLQRDPPARLLNTKLVQVTASDGIKYIAQDDSWLMFRGSGTEPVLRIYSEARTPARVRQLLEWGERRAREVSR